MKAFVKYISVIDNQNRIHHVEFKEGVNIITGKSSTGKSAIIEIFDYCFGSSEFNIPDGVITQNAHLYFTVIALSDIFLILGRTTKNIHYLSIETDVQFVSDVFNFDEDYFIKLETLSSTDFNKELNKYFKINIEDTDVDLEDRLTSYNNRKKAAPSFRHFTSFLLQHQNLIANKHALFYRFDEKEKKEQTIEQFKIFLGLVDAHYFPLRQRLAEKIKEKKYKEAQKDRNIKLQELIHSSLDDLLQEYEIKTNKKLFLTDSDKVMANPKFYLNYLDNFEVQLSESEDSNIIRRNGLQKEYNNQLAEIRKLQNIISNIDVSIMYAHDFSKQKTNISTFRDSSDEQSRCIFCGSENGELEMEKSKLAEALSWFNSEMTKSSYTIQSFESDKKQYENQIKIIREHAKKIKIDINIYDKVIQQLNKNRSVEDQALKIKLKVETFLETIDENNVLDIQNEIDTLNDEIHEIEEILKRDYNVTGELLSAARHINQEMNLLGKKLDFEPIYKENLNLKFDIDTFELYQQNIINGLPSNKVYLRSMGSGANWLHTHIALFASLIYYFCSLREKCLIPTFLFIDQPSQVYFPSDLDRSEKFDARSLKEVSLKNGENLETRTNEDLAAVTNLYNQLHKFCEKTYNETGIRPQFIITDHADHLKLEDVEFETLVRARWRADNEGFINLN
ncbi:MAG: DUF3732 domain-containing protein [Flavobacterium sp.]|nr:MAG: DUF3732 domain-containing protein [Flavobacterium sp.]